MLRATKQLVYVGIKGTVLAIDRATGAEAWRTELKGSDFVNVVLDGEELFASTKGELFCLDPQTGRIRWNNPLKGLGWGLLTIATAPDGNLSAMNEYRRRQEQAASSAAVATMG